jgi:hypothetical protein
MKVGARYYDPTIGRWIQKDPILSGFNWWLYCENDPVNHVDQEGQFIVEITMIAVYGCLIAESIIVFMPIIVVVIILYKGNEIEELPHIHQPEPPNPYKPERPQTPWQPLPPYEPPRQPAVPPQQQPRIPIEGGGWGEGMNFHIPYPFA